MIVNLYISLLSIPFFVNSQSTLEKINHIPFNSTKFFYDLLNPFHSSFFINWQT